MPANWDPGAFEEFRRAVGEGRCDVVLHRWTRDWARTHGWSILGFYSDWWFIRRLTSNEKDFWLAYQEGAFDLHLREPNDVWGNAR